MVKEDAPDRAKEDLEPAFQSTRGFGLLGVILVHSDFCVIGFLSFPGHRMR